jgi:hypothetical protein
MCSPPPTLRGLSLHQAEQYVIHTQRGPSGKADLKRPTDRRHNGLHASGAIGSPRRRTTRQASSKNTPTSGNRGDGAVHEKIKPRGSPARGSPHKNASPSHGRPCATVVEVAAPPSSSPSRATEQELWKQNEELRLQVQAMRDEQKYTAELHSQVIANVVKERNELVKELEAERANHSTHVSGDGMEALVADTTIGTASAGKPDASAETTVVLNEQKASGPGQAAEERAQEAIASWEAHATARSLSPSFPSYSPGPPLPEASVFMGPMTVDATTIDYAEEAEAPSPLPPRAPPNARDTLASRAQCWELQGALRKALQSQRASARQSKASVPVESMVLFSPPAAPPPSPLPAQQHGRATLPARKNNSSPIKAALMTVNGRPSAPLRTRSTFGGGELPSALVARGGSPVRPHRVLGTASQSVAPGAAGNLSSGQGLVPLAWSAPLKPGPSRSNSARGVSPPSQRNAQLQSSCTAAPASFGVLAQPQSRESTPVRGSTPTWGSAPPVPAAFVAATQPAAPLSRTPSAESLVPLPAALLAATPSRSTKAMSSATVVRVMARSATSPHLTKSSAGPSRQARKADKQVLSATPSAVHTARSVGGVASSELEACVHTSMVDFGELATSMPVLEASTSLPVVEFSASLPLMCTEVSVDRPEFFMSPGRDTYRA